MLTQNQQQTIQFLTEQFEKLNGSQQPNRKFNLVDIKPLQDKAERIRQLDEEEKIHEQIWKDAQKNERNRILRLLLEDLPNVVMATNCQGGIKICRKDLIDKKYEDIGFEDCVRIAVSINYDYVYDEYSEKKRTEYNSLYYILNNNFDKYKTIEELCATDEFKDTLRKRVL